MPCSALFVTVATLLIGLIFRRLRMLEKDIEHCFERITVFIVQASLLFQQVVCQSSELPVHFVENFGNPHGLFEIVSCFLQGLSCSGELPLVFRDNAFSLGSPCVQ